MRKLTPVLVLLTVLCLACNNENKPIKKAAYDYCMATANYDIDGAEAFCTEETRRTTLATARYLLTMVDTAYITADTPATIKITDVLRTSDTTAVAVYHKVTPLKDFSDTLELRLRDGRWLAHSPRLGR